MLTSRHALVGWSVVMLLLAVLWPRGGSWSAHDQYLGYAHRQSHATGDSLQIQETVEVRFQPDASAAVSAEFTRVAAGLIDALPRFPAAVRRLLLALAAIGCAGWLFASGVTSAWLLLPLTFCGLVPGLNAVAALMTIPAVRFLFLKQDNSLLGSMSAGLLLALAGLFDPRALLLCGAVSLFAAYQWWPVKSVSFLSGTLAGLIVCFYVEPGILDQFTIPETTRLATRAYMSLLATDRNPIYGLAPLFLLLVSVWAAHQMDVRGTRRHTYMAVFTLLLGFGIMLVRIWSAPRPLDAWLNGNSIVVWCPWVAALLIAPFIRRPEFVISFLTILASALLLPSNEPARSMAAPWMVALPLLSADFVKALKPDSAVVRIALLATLLQTAALTVLVWSRADECSDHIRYLSEHVKSPLIASSEQIGLELAPLAEDRQFFIVSDPAALFELAMEFRAAGQDTFYLCLHPQDSLLGKTFPNGKLVRPVSMTITRGGEFYVSLRRSYTLVIQPDQFFDLEGLDQALLEAGEPLQVLDPAPAQNQGMRAPALPDYCGPAPLPDCNKREDSVPDRYIGAGVG